MWSQLRCLIFALNIREFFAQTWGFYDFRLEVDNTTPIKIRITESVDLKLAYLDCAEWTRTQTFQRKSWLQSIGKLDNFVELIWKRENPNGCTLKTPRFEIFLQTLFQSGVTRWCSNIRN